MLTAIVGLGNGPTESNGSTRMVPQCLPYCKIIKTQAYPSVSVMGPCFALSSLEPLKCGIRTKPALLVHLLQHCSAVISVIIESKHKSVVEFWSLYYSAKGWKVPVQAP